MFGCFSFFVFHAKSGNTKSHRNGLSDISYNTFFCLVAFIDSFPTVCWLCFTLYMQVLGFHLDSIFTSKQENAQYEKKTLLVVFFNNMLRNFTDPPFKK